LPSSSAAAADVDNDAEDFGGNLQTRTAVVVTANPGVISQCWDLGLRNL